MDTLGVITRSRTTGYKAFPEVDDSWWESSKYERLTRVEAPTLILKGTPTGVKFFLSGISSEYRNDKVGTPIRYTLFGVANSKPELSSLIWAVESFKSDKSLRRVGCWLDKTIGDEVEVSMEGKPHDASGTLFLDALQESWLELHNKSNTNEFSKLHDRVVLGRKHEDFSCVVGSRIREIFERKQGSIVFLNLAKLEDYKDFEEGCLLALLKGSSIHERLKKKARAVNPITMRVVVVTLVIIITFGILYLTR